MTDDTIHIEEELKEAAEKAEATGKRWTEEISVRGSELGHTLSRLGREAIVRSITVKTAGGSTYKIPFVLGAAGVLVLGPWTAAVLAAAWLGRVSILIEYEEAPATMEEAVKEMAGVMEDTADDIEANLKTA